MTLLEYVISLQDQGYTEPEIVEKAEEFKKQNQQIDPPVKEAKKEDAADQKGATVASETTNAPLSAVENLLKEKGIASKYGNGRLPAATANQSLEDLNKPFFEDIAKDIETKSGARAVTQKDIYKLPDNMTKVAELGDVYTPGDGWDYKYIVNPKGDKIDYYTRRENTEDFIKVEDAYQQFAVADQFDHLTEDQKKAFNQAKNHRKKTNEEKAIVATLNEKYDNNTLIPVIVDIEDSSNQNAEASLSSNIQYLDKLIEENFQNKEGEFEIYTEQGADFVNKIIEKRNKLAQELQFALQIQVSPSNSEIQAMRDESGVLMPDDSRKAYFDEETGQYIKGKQLELPKATDAQAFENYKKRTGKEATSVMQLTEEDYVLTEEQDPFNTTLSIIQENKERSKGVVFYKELFKKWESWGNRFGGKVLSLPTWWNQQLATIALDDKSLAALNALPYEQRSKAINSIAAKVGIVPGVGEVSNYMLEVSERMFDEAEKVDATIAKYETSLTESFGEGNIITNLARLSTEALGSAGSLIEVSIPGVGIPLLIVGEASAASREKQRQGDDLSLGLSGYSLTVGLAEGALEAVSLGIAKKAFNMLPKGSKEEAFKSVFEYVKQIGIDFLKEGASESGTFIISEIADHLYEGDEKAFEMKWMELIDTFIIGGAFGAKISGAGAAKTFITQGAANRKINRALDNSAFNTISEVFGGPTQTDTGVTSLEADNVVQAPAGLRLIPSNPQTTNEAVAIAAMPNSLAILNTQLKADVNSGLITQSQADAIKQNFLSVQNSVKSLKAANINVKDQAPMVDLLIEQADLKKQIKNSDNPSLVKPQTERLAEIDSELTTLVSMSFIQSSATREGAQKMAEQLGASFENFSDQDSIDKRAEELRNDGYDVQDSTGYGMSLNKDGEKIILINDRASAEDNVYTTDQHEILHPFFLEALKGDTDAATRFGKALLTEIINNPDISGGQELMARFDQYVNDPNYSGDMTWDEVIPLVSESLSNGDIKYNQKQDAWWLSLAKKIISPFLKKAGLNLEFNSGKDVFNFLLEYNKTIESGKGFTDAQLKIKEEGAKGALVEGEVEVDRRTKGSRTVESISQTLKDIDALSDKDKADITRESKRIESSLDVQKLYEEQGVGAAFDIIQKFKPITNRIVESRSQAPNFDRQLLTDEIETGPRGILDLITEYKPESGVPLAAYINKFLPARAIEASRRVLGEEFTTDVTEAKGVIAEETTEVETKEKPLAKKPTETVEFSQVQIEKIGAKDKAEVETKITEATKDSFKNQDIKTFGQTRNVPKAVADIYAGIFGLNPQTITDKTRNYQKTDAEGLTTAKQFLLKNANNDFARLPKTKDGFGKGTFLPRNVMNALYTNGKLTGTLKDYMDLIRQKPTKPIYRDAVGQTIRGLLNLHIRNRMFEDLVTTTAERAVGGAKFSKRMLQPRKAAEYIEKASKQTRSSSKQEGTKQQGTKSNGKPRRVYDRNKLLGDDVKSFEGETVIQGFDRTLNKFLDKNPKFNDYLKFSLVFGESRSPYGIVSRFKERLKRIGNQADIRRTPMTKDRMVTNSYAKAIFEPGYVAKEKAKLDLLKDFYLAAEDYLKQNPKDAWVFDAIASAATNSQNSPLRALAPALIIQVDANGKVVRNVRGIEEHTEPQNNVGTTLTQAAKDGRVNEVWPVIEASYMQGWITLENNDLLDVDFKKSMPDLYYKGVELFKDGKLKLDQGLLSTIRLSEAGIDLSTMLYIPTKQTLSEYFFGTNNIQQAEQAKLMRDLFSGVKTLEQVKEYAKNETKLFEDKVKDAEINNNTQPDNIKLDKTNSRQSKRVVKSLNVLDKALNNARKPDAPIKKIRVFDFDDTLARSKSKVLYTVPNVEGGFSEGATKLKAIFMVGGPGAGKTNVGKGLQLGRRGYKVVNQDIALEAMKEEAGLPAKESEYTAEQRSTRSKLGAAARKAAVAKFDKYAAAGNGMVIDGTGASYNATTKKIKALQDAGYEVHMVVATTPLETAIERNRARTERSLPDFVVKKTYENVQESLKKYREDFGDRLYEINTETIEYGKPLPTEFLQQVYAGINANKVGKVDATSFAENYDVLESQGAEFDFREFSKVIEGQKGPLFSVAEKIAAARGTDDIFILTARPADAAKPIQEFMKANGIDIPLQNITGLGDGTAAAKGRWIAGKAAEGYNDFYFADDAIKNVQAVKDVLSQVDVKSKVQQARASKRKTFDKVFNNIIEAKTGIESYKQYSAAKAKTVGANKGRFTFFTTPSAEDFLGLMYKLLGKGKVGDAQMAFIKENLIDPYNRAEMAISQAKVAAGRDYKALKKKFKNIPKTLEKETGIAKYSYQHAIRTYIWNSQGIEVPGLSKRDQTRLVEFVQNDAELSVFADNLISIQKGRPYPNPDKNWTAGNITTDVISGINKVNRAEYLQEWQENVDIIFSEKNMNKLEAAFGANYVEALKDSLRAMKSGSNRPLGGDRVSNAILDWLNNSVGAIMFLNTRSAVLQTISAVNFINWGDNNILKAGKAFANQKQFWGDFLTLMNSDYLLERRDGLKINVSESEIADAVEGSKNKVNAAISYLLNKGFVFTRYADSFAIASGGATFYRNRIESLVEQGMDRKLAEQQAFEDFRLIAEENQQSSSPMRISQQQRSLIGRIVLQFGNTQLQYVRIQKRAVQDLVNGRGDWRSNISKIVYYGAVQNLLFNALQSGLAWAMFDDDEDDEEKAALTKKNKEQKLERALNGAIDSQLKGLGIQGAVIAGVKNALMTIAEQADKKSPKFEDALDDLLSIAPALGSKIRKLKSAARTVSWNRKEIKEKGFSMDNPAYLAGAQTISAVFNIPLDRAVMKMNNMRNILNPATENWQKVALTLGWSTWDVGLPYFGLAEDKPVLTETEKQTKKLFDINKSDQVKMLLDLGLTKKEIRALTKEEQRVQQIIKLQNKKKDAGSKK
jgi:biotin operon repressor